jgi:hypothetical protein
MFFGDSRATIDSGRFSFDALALRTFEFIATEVDVVAVVVVVGFPAVECVVAEDGIVPVVVDAVELSASWRSMTSLKTTLSTRKRIGAPS